MSIQDAIEFVESLQVVDSDSDAQVAIIVAEDIEVEYESN